MKRVAIFVAVVLALALAVGCTHVVSAKGGNTAMANDAWFTEITALPLGPPPGLALSTRVYYCPPTTGGAATCMEAEMIENASAGSGGAAAAPAAAPAAEAEKAGEEAGKSTEEAAEEATE